MASNIRLASLAWPFLRDTLSSQRPGVAASISRGALYAYAQGMKLTADQRAALYSGKAPKITFPGADPCPVAPGHIEALSTQVWLEVTEVRRTAKGDHVLVYTLYNNRIGQRFLAVQAGQIQPEQYAHSGGSSIDPEAGEAVDEQTQARLTQQARERDQHARTEAVGELLGAMETMRCAIDSLSAERSRRMSRTLWQLRSRLDSAEHEMRRRLAA
jgi:hypothetical protein